MDQGKPAASGRKCYTHLQTRANGVYQTEHTALWDTGATGWENEGWCSVNLQPSPVPSAQCAPLVNPPRKDRSQATSVDGVFGSSHSFDATSVPCLLALEPCLLPLFATYLSGTRLCTASVTNECNPRIPSISKAVRAPSSNSLARSTSPAPASFIKDDR